MNKWVRHISGIGEKWKVCGQDSSGAYIVLDGDSSYYLPKSEYHEVSGPEEWEDVTNECEIQANGEIWHMAGHKRSGISVLTLCTVTPNYRLRKVQLYAYYQPTEITQWAFLVERRKP